MSMNVSMEIGAVTETVVVTDQAPLLETRTSDTSQLVEARNVQDMPLGDRRTMNIIQMTGAAVFVNYDSGGKPNFSLAGGRTQSQSFYMDGGTIQNMRLGIGQVDTDPPVETVAEVKVLSNNYAAEFGGSAGGVIVATTKSGTNQLRGSAYEYLRNEQTGTPPTSSRPFKMARRCGLPSATTSSAPPSGGRSSFPSSTMAATKRSSFFPTKALAVLRASVTSSPFPKWSSARAISARRSPLRPAPHRAYMIRLSNRIVARKGAAHTVRK
ncbi:MAG: TonB-dependent receptor plug domain-containing protein [Bryobacterales bacterium]|nr:TonB-dependent receptor plug domain-containing protein [Bryobacterales bacterium]